MNKDRYIQTLTSITIVLIIFYIGFHFGKKNTIKSLPPANILNTANLENGADMEPYWKVWNILEDNFSPASSTAPKVSNEDKIWGSIQGLASSYKDPYTVFFPPVESKAFEEQISGSFGGVGMEMDIGADGFLTVVAPLKDTPAERAGIISGDKVIAVDRKSVINMPINEAIKLIKGDIGTEVEITLVRKGIKDPIVKKIIRAKINIPTINTKLLPNNIFVIELYSFTATAPDLFRKALREFVESGSDKLILDLRNNPGGYLEASLDMASWFLPQGKLVVSENFGDKKPSKVYKSKGYDVFNDNLKFVILVNEGSASASEILAGALREHKKAILIGSKTFGKGSVQELLPVTSDTSLKVTVAHWFTPEGNSISDGGLTPDIEVKLTKENTENGNDPVMEKAVEYLTK